MITAGRTFVEQVYLPDLLAIAGFYKEWASIGGGTPNFMSVGEFPEGSIKDVDKLYFPRGIILNKDLTKVHPYDHAGVTEGITSSWYSYTGGDKAMLHPYEGETKPNYTGPTPPWDVPAGARQVHVDEVAALQRPADAGRAAGADARRLRVRAQGSAGERQHGTEDARRRTGRALLHARPHRRARHRDAAPGRPDAGVVRPARDAHQERRHEDLQQLQVGAGHVAEVGEGVWLAGCAARLARPLGASSRTGRSRTTSASCRARGIARRATRRESWGRTRRR